MAIPPGTKQIIIAPQIYGPGKVWFDDLAAEYTERRHDRPDRLLSLVPLYVCEDRDDLACRIRDTGATTDRESETSPEITYPATSRCYWRPGP